MISRVPMQARLATRHGWKKIGQRMAVTLCSHHSCDSLWIFGKLVDGHLDNRRAQTTCVIDSRRRIIFKIGTETKIEEQNDILDDKFLVGRRLRIFKEVVLFVHDWLRNRQKRERANGLSPCNLNRRGQHKFSRRVDNSRCPHWTPRTSVALHQVVPAPLHPERNIKEYHDEVVGEDLDIDCGE